MTERDLIELYNSFSELLESEGSYIEDGGLTLEKRASTPSVEISRSTGLRYVLKGRKIRVVDKAGELGVLDLWPDGRFEQLKKKGL